MCYLEERNMRPEQRLSARAKEVLLQRDRRACRRCEAWVSRYTASFDLKDLKTSPQVPVDGEFCITLCESCCERRLPIRGDIASAIAKGIVPATWREFTWESLVEPAETDS